MRLSLRDVSVHYPGADRPAVSLVSFTVNAGERVALLGPSGSGKTTVLNVAAGLIDPTGGVVERDGVSPSQLRGAARRASDARIGMMHQQLHLIGSLRVVHNVNAGMLPAWSTPTALRSLWLGPVETQAAQQVLARVGIADKLRERTASLSGGQQQRVAVARLLRQQPELLVADEPVSAVDPAWSEEVLRVLREESETRGASMLVSLHDVGLAHAFCDRLIGLRDGHIVFDRPSSDVTSNDIEQLYVLSRSEPGVRRGL